ncbi:hypothetical protein BDV93DRAFT_545672 [Ceratobasidium sp. AG-I]|nr:hypothetical protein BDV93DRAFT_545672 [Ceratobasidium sp. AG-I]
MSTTTTTQACRKVFETPELLSHICSYATKRSCYRLLRTKKSGFLSAAPFVWKEIGNVIHLLNLLPHIQTITEKRKIVKIILQPLSQTDFTRFEVYAPFVKVLELYKRDGFFETSGWRTMSMKAEEGPLLPKLSGLIVRLSTESPTSHTQGLMWIRSLLSPMLKSVQLIANQGTGFPIHSNVVGSAILEAIARVCPRVEKLSLFPLGGSSESDEEHFLLSLLPRKHFFQYLPALCNLSELETSMTMVRPEVFPLLGELPRLRRLVLCSVSTESVVSPVDLPDHAFLVLEHLILNGLRHTEVEMVLDLSSLVRNITSFELFMSLDEHQGEWIIDEFFPRLENMPHLNHLSARFDQEGLLGYFQDINFESVLDALAKLPLRTLHLRGVNFQDEVDFSEIFSSLVKLDIIDDYVTPGRLSVFATIPKLEHLIICIDGDVDLGIPDDDPPNCPSLHTLEIDNPGWLACNPVWMCATAEYLLKLFPNVKVQSSFDKHPSERDDGIAWLNSQIILQRELQRLRSRVIDKYGQDETDSIIPSDFPLNIYKSTT